MAGTTQQVRSIGNPESEIEHLRVTINLLIDDIELLRSTSNTANGGNWSLAAGSLLAYKITLI
jgi:hypothetical protein